MAEERELKSEAAGDLYLMRKEGRCIVQALCAKVKRDDSEMIALHGERLIAAVSGAVRMIRGRERIPAEKSGLPYLYLFLKVKMKTANRLFAEEMIFEALQSEEGKHCFSDEELLLLPSFLVLGAAALYIEEGKTHYVETILDASEMDISSIFFSFSEIERIFLRERIGVYRVVDEATRNLYHDRLLKLAKREKKDAILLAGEIIEEANSRGVHIGEILGAYRGTLPKIYFHVLSSATAVFLFLFSFFSQLGYWNFLMFPFLLLPLYRLAKTGFEPYFTRCGERILPKLSGAYALMDTKVMVSIATFLFGEEKDAKIFDKLEDMYLTNHSREENVIFAVVGDLPQSKKRTTDRDEAILSYAEKRICALSAKYGEHFALFIRGRRRSASEDAYIGWERKRGSVLELCRFLRGKKAGFLLEICDRSAVSAVKYLITLDADTNLYAGAVGDLVGAMRHPENIPIIDPQKNIVVSGHAVIQPRMTTTLSSASVTAFAALTGGEGGLDIYASAGSDFYQSVFDEGIYCGKGILDVDVFLTVCDGFFPRERILSHDLAEGNLLRAALAPDIILSDGTPKNAVSYYIREHRWIRGDLQLFPYLARYVKNENGEVIENPMSPLSKYKIADNLLRAATPFFSLIALFISAFFGVRPMLATALAVFSPSLFSVLQAMVADMRHHGLPAIFRSLSVLFFRVSALAYEAFLFVDAAVRTAYRFLVSHKNFLNWTTASAGDQTRCGYPDDYILRFSPSMMIGLLFFCIDNPVSRLLGTFWMLVPFVFFGLSREKRKISRLCERDRCTLFRYTHDAWLFFRDYVNEDTHGLPPDNVQLSPTYAIAKRTSPTNIGLYLLSLLAARDLGYITSSELYERSWMTARTLSSLFKWNGHLYNWYSTETLAVLGEAFVSTVDSGNLITALVAFCEGLKEYAGEEPKMLDVIVSLEEIISETDFSALYDRSRGLFYVGYHVKNGTYTSSHYDTFMSESRLTSYYAVAKRFVPREHYFKSSRRVIGSFGNYGIASWSGTAFEYFMPTLLLPSVKRSLSDFALSFAYRVQKKHAVKRVVLGKRRAIFGVSESGYFAFDGEMNYQYHAFGTERLSLDPMVRAEEVIAPYASFLMLEVAPERVTENLGELEALGMYGKYGFYEALDLERFRVGKGYARIQSFMAHHVGMSIVAAANLLHDGIFRKRFLKDPSMRAMAELLSERMPSVFLPYAVKKRYKSGDLSVRDMITKEENTQEYAYTLLHPEMAMVTNNKTRIFASSSGHVAIENGMTQISYSDFDLYGLGSGLRIYVNIDGAILPTVPLMKAAEGFSSEFSFESKSDALEYHSRHVNGRLAYDITLRFSVYPDREICDIVCQIGGTFSRAYAVLYFEPVLTGKREYLSHKSFSGLFLESEYHEDEGVILFRRRARSERLTHDFLGIRVTPSERDGFFDTMRDRVLRLCPNEGTYAALAGEREFSDSKGAVIIPACAVKSGKVGMRKGRIAFTIGADKDADDLLYALSDTKRDTVKRYHIKMGDLLNLQYSVAGLSRSVAPLEKFVLRSMIFGQIRPRSESFRHIDKNAFWRFSVSGDNPIVLAKEIRMDENTGGRLRELIALFKYMCIRGARYDLVLLYHETDCYSNRVREWIMRKIRRAGCEHFLSWSCGIFLIHAEALSSEEQFSYELMADAIFDLTAPLREIATENARAIPLSAETEMLLRMEAETRPMASEKPMVNEIYALQGGIFHKDGFLLKKPHGKAPFAHVLASQNFGTVLTENSLGFTFARNAGLCKLTPHTADGMLEDAGERLLLRIYDIHGRKRYRDYDLCAVSSWVDYTFSGAVYHGSVEGICFSVRIALCGKSDIKMTEVTIESEKKLLVSLIFSVSPAIGVCADGRRFYRFRRERDGIRISRFSDGGMKNAEIAVFSPDATVLYTEMAALRSDGSVFRGESDAAILVSRMELLGKRRVRFYLSAVFSEAHASSLRALCATDHENTFSEIAQAVMLKTEDALFDEIVNKWSLYQTLYARIYARSGFYQVSGAFGFRDQLQDALSLIQPAPHIAKTIIFRAAAHQYEEGDVQHFWHPRGAGLRSRCSDDFLWLAYVTLEYVRQTGDTEILNAKIAYLTSPVLAKGEEDRYEMPKRTDYRESLWAHMKRAVNHADRLGTHGLPLIGSCDWNDGMNGVGREGRGESVWLAFFHVLVYEDMARLSESLGEDGMIYREKQRARMDAIREQGYDGAWYRRGYYDDGTPLGSAQREDCRIDAIAQAFAGIAAETLAFEMERAVSSMRSAEKYLFDRRHRMFRLLTPPFEKDEQSPGYIKGYVAGIRENGGQYTHAAVWAALGFFGCHMNDIGTELLFAINPAGRARDTVTEENYRIEPYVFAGDVYANPSHMGRGGWSWYTGSAAWYRRAVIEWLCGYRETKDGFTLTPRFSDRFASFSLDIRKKETCYHIEVCKGKRKTVVIDGKSIDSCDHFSFDGGTHTVCIFLADF